MRKGDIVLMYVPITPWGDWMMPCAVLDKKFPYVNRIMHKEFLESELINATSG